MNEFETNKNTNMNTKRKELEVILEKLIRRATVNRFVTKTDKMQFAEQIEHLFAPPAVSDTVCDWCKHKLCDSQIFNNTCFACGKSPFSKQIGR